MRNLIFFGILLILSSCSELESPLGAEGVDADDISFAARSSKPKKGNYQGHLSGEQTLATGQVNFTFAADNLSVYYKLKVANIEDVMGAHLHHAHMGAQPGHIVLTLFQGFAAGTSNGVLAEGVLKNANITCECNDPSHHTLANLRQHIEDGETSVVVHTDQFQQGEIAGPIR
jgi:hypothetical protein